MRLFLRFIQMFGRQYRLRLVAIFLLSIIAGFLEIFGIAMIFPFIAMVNNPGMVKTSWTLGKINVFFGFTNEHALIYLAAVAVGGAFLLKNLFMLYYQYLQLDIVRRWRNDICHTLMRKYLTAPYLFHLQKSSSHMMNVLSNTVSLVLNSFVFSQMNLISNLIVTFMLVGFVLSKYFYATLISATIMVVMTIIQARFIRNHTRHVNDQITKTSAKNLSVLSQALTAIKETKTFLREEYFQNMYGTSNKIASEQNMSSQMVQTLPMYINEIILVVTVIVMACLVLAQGDNVIIDVANLGVLAGAAFRLAPMINRTLNSYGQISVSSGATAELLDELENLNTLAAETGDAATCDVELRRNLSLDNIMFRYNDGPSIALTNVSLDIRAGEFIGIIGASGAGKTTLVDIILGLLRPTTGRIHVDATEITTQNLHCLRKLVGYVSQNPYIFEATVEQNVAFGVDPHDIDRPRVIQALEFAQLYDLFRDSKKHLETPIGEHGKSLSGGQRQRLAIARALYADPQILVLDEATSALDVETENEITQVINKLKGKRTVIAIAHRLSTLKNCDRIIYMAHGQIVDVGTFRELQERHASFSRILELSSLH